MTSQEIKISIVSALNAAGIDATKKQISQMTKTVSGNLKGMTTESKTHMADFKAGFDLLCSGIQKAWIAVKTTLASAFSFETQTTQFKTLIGNIDEAKRHMKDLKELGDTPPFSLDQFAAASRQMMVMTDGALGYKRSLELVGDAAAATGVPIEQLGHAVGRAFAFIRDGVQITTATEQLRSMGVITPELVEKLKSLQAAGKSNAELWAEVEKQLGRYNGAMAETEKTGEGMVGAIQSRWVNIVRTFGTAFESSAKGGLSLMLDKMKQLEEDGSVQVWASRVAQALASVVSGVKVAVSWAGKLVDAYHWVQDKLEVAGSYYGSMVGALANGASLSQAADMAANSAVQTSREQVDRKEDAAKAEAEIRDKAKEKSKAREAERDAAERARITDQLNAKQAAKEEEDRAKERESEKKEVDKWLAEDNKEQLSEATKKLADARSDAEKAEADVKAADEKLKKAIERYNANLAQNMTQDVVRSYYTNTNFNNTLQNGFGAVMKAIPSIGKAAGEQAVNAAAAEGKIRSTQDYDRVYNAAARQARIDAYRDGAKANADDARALRLSKMSDKALSQADREWLEKYRKTQESRNKDAAEKAAEEQAKIDAETRRRVAFEKIGEITDDIKEINQRLANLGLK